MSAARRAPVAVVVVSWNGREHLAGCLASLAGLERTPAETVVVDNASTDGTVAMVEERFPWVRVRALSENTGFCRANNVGIAATSSPFVLVLNPDTRLTAGFLEHLLPAFEAPDVGIAAGKLLRFDGRTLDSCGQRLARSRQPIDRGYGRLDRGRYERDEDVFGACGAAALYRRAALESIADPGARVFDEAFFAFYEDLDVAWRMRRLGWRAVYRHRAVGYHARGGTARGNRAVRRFAALLGRSAAVRYHIAKNRYLAILRNDTPGAYLRALPFVLARDVATAAILLATAPGVLIRLARSGPLFRAALAKRALDAARPRLQTDRGGHPAGDDR